MNFYVTENGIVIMKDYIWTAESTERVRGVKFGVKIGPYELSMLPTTLSMFSRNSVWTWTALFHVGEHTELQNTRTNDLVLNLFAKRIIPFVT